MNVLKFRARNFFIMAVLTLVLFAVIYGTLQPAADARTLISAAAFIALYFVYQGAELLHIVKKEKYEAEKYICTSINKSGYRRQNRKIIFVQAETKEPFIFNTTKNVNYIEGMEYDIYFRKGHKTSMNVLAISLADTQEQSVKDDIK